MSIGLLSLSINNSALACVQPTDEQYQNMGFLLSVNKTEVESYLSKYCMDYNKLNNSIPNTRNVDTFKVIEKNNPDIFNYSNNINQNLLSLFIIEYTTKEIKPSEKIEREIFALYKTRFPQDNRTFEEINYYPDSLKEKDRYEILNYISSKMKATKLLQKDNVGNSTLSYIILGNTPILISNLETTIPNLKSFLTQRNLDNYNMLHLMFSPTLKNKDTSLLNDKIISLINKQSIILSGFPSIGFAEFAEIMKENNLDFYNKIKEKFKLNPNIDKIKNIEESKKRINENLDYLKKFNIHDKIKTPNVSHIKQ